MGCDGICWEGDYIGGRDSVFIFSCEGKEIVSQWVIMDSSCSSASSESINDTEVALVCSRDCNNAWGEGGFKVEEVEVGLVIG